MQHIDRLNKLKIISLGIDTYHENVIFMRSDCPICRSEGFTALTRLVVHHNQNSIIATLNVIHSNLLQENEAALSDMAQKRLLVNEGDFISISHLNPSNR